MKALLFISAVLLLGTRLSASVGTDLLEDQIKVLLEEKGSASPKTRGDCTNFTGNWEGTCKTNNGQVVEKKMKIVQTDCRSLLVNGTFYPIETSIGKSMITPEKVLNPTEYATFQTTQPSWDAQSKTLVFLHSATGHTLLPISGFHSTSMGKEEWTLKDAKLHTVEKMETIVWFRSQWKRLTFDVACEYSAK